MNLQNVRNNANTPHVSVEREGFIVDYFRTDEFRSSKHFTNLLSGLDFSAESKIDQFKRMTTATFKHYIFGF